MNYVDGYVLPLPKKNVAAYRKLATLAGRAWVKHGALEYNEAVGDDLNTKFGLPFPKTAKSKANETVVFAWVVFKSRAHRDKVNAKVMKDHELHEASEECGGMNIFDVKRMSYGGFDVIVSENAKKTRRAPRKAAKTKAAVKKAKATTKKKKSAKRK